MCNNILTKIKRVRQLNYTTIIFQCISNKTLGKFFYQIDTARREIQYAGQIKL